MKIANLKRLVSIALLMVFVIALSGCQSANSNKDITDLTVDETSEDISQSSVGNDRNNKETESISINDAEKNDVGQTESPQTELTEANENGSTDEGVTEMVIRITAGEHVITATLYDNAAGRALWDKLPLTLPMMNLYGREMCYRFGAGGLPEDDAEDTGYAIGDISYWPPAGSLVILYRQNGEVFEQQPVGHTDDDISFFDGMPDTDITFEKLE